MQLYDSRTQKKITIPNDQVGMYCCGPTVYNDVHIGNVRPLITFDILYRYLLHSKIKTTYVHNITDVDDKIINKAQEVNVSESKISEEYTDHYTTVMKQLNALKMDELPKVTKNIDGIIKYVEKLVNLDKAYVSQEGDVYFSIDTVKDTYGEISKQNIEQLLDGVRKENKKDKRNLLDFVLWKKTDLGINWKTPWSEHGRPGWHTECAYFINKFFGDTVTIHGGGIDLKFPHHENENAQNIALTGKEMASVWMHVGHININNVKMSKSLNNFIYAKDLISDYGSNVIRWYFLQAHYASPMNFSKDLMEQNRNEFNKFIKLINNALVQLLLFQVDYKFEQVEVSREFKNYMEDNLDFANVVSLLWSKAKGLTTPIRNKTFDAVIDTLNNMISELEILGITVETKFDKSVVSIIADWRKALETKDYKTADAKRNELQILNII